MQNTVSASFAGLKPGARVRFTQAIAAAMPDLAGRTFRVVAIGGAAATIECRASGRRECAPIKALAAFV